MKKRLLTGLIFLFAGLGLTCNVCAGNRGEGPLPALAGANLTLLQAPGWDDKIVLSTEPGTSTSATSFNTTQVIYLDWAVWNNGTDNIDLPFTVKIYIDQAEKGSYEIGGLGPSYYTYRSDLVIGPLESGSHTIRVAVDTGNAVAETDEGDNEAVRTLEVQLLIIPDIDVSPAVMTFRKDGLAGKSTPVTSAKAEVPFIAPVPDSLVAGQFTDDEGNRIDVIRVGGYPPATRMAQAASVSAGAVLLSDMPAYQWSFGCSPTSAAMMAGYYDHHGYAGMYTGPANGGVAPLTSAVWGSTDINGENRILCPLSASRNGLDGRTTRGHADDYWINYGSTAADPYITNGWSQHSPGDCTGDFMKTNQSAFGNSDGATTFYYSGGGLPYTGTNERDGGYGFELFLESRGYTVTSRFNQYILGYDGSTTGFSFEDYVAEIDAGRPVMLHLTSHTVVGVGYDLAGSTIYLHDTWDYDLHSMTWGGSYNGYPLYAASVFRMVPTDLFTVTNTGTGNLQVTSLTGNRSWLSFTPGTPFTLGAGESRSIKVSVDWNQVYGSDTGTITILSNDADEPVSTVEVRVIIDGLPSVAGKVFLDADRLTDNLVDGTGTSAGDRLYVNLLDAAQQVVATGQVQSGGEYALPVAGSGTFTLQLTVNQGTPGNASPASLLPPGWIYTGENLGSTAGSDGEVNGLLVVAANGVSSIDNANFGIVRLPDVTAGLTVSPNVMSGVTLFNLTVRVTELNAVSTEGAATVIIPRDSRWALDGGYNPALTVLGSTPLNNSAWSYDATDENYHIFTSATVIPGGNFSTFGFRGIFNPGNTRGLCTVTSQVLSGSGGENQGSNNSDSEKLDYFSE